MPIVVLCDDCGDNKATWYCANCEEYSCNWCKKYSDVHAFGKHKWKRCSAIARRIKAAIEKGTRIELSKIKKMGTSFSSSIQAIHPRKKS